MWFKLRTPLRIAPLVRSFGYEGGVPGNNLPFRKGMDNVVRFTIFWTIIGSVGFGAPWLVVRHQMLRNTSDAPPPEEQ